MSIVETRYHWIISLCFYYLLRRRGGYPLCTPPTPCYTPLILSMVRCCIYPCFSRDFCIPWCASAKSLTKENPLLLSNRSGKATPIKHGITNRYFIVWFFLVNLVKYYPLQRDSEKCRFYCILEALTDLSKGGSKKSVFFYNLGPTPSGLFPTFFLLGIFFSSLKKSSYWPAFSSPPPLSGRAT